MWDVLAGGLVALASVWITNYHSAKMARGQREGDALAREEERENNLVVQIRGERKTEYRSFLRLIMEPTYPNEHEGRFTVVERWMESSYSPNDALMSFPLRCVRLCPASRLDVPPPIQPFQWAIPRTARGVSVAVIWRRRCARASGIDQLILNIETPHCFRRRESVSSTANRSDNTLSRSFAV